MNIQNPFLGVAGALALLGTSTRSARSQCVDLKEPEDLTVANIGDKLSAKARALPGLDQSRFDACMAKHTMASRIDQDAVFARENGISSTPTLFVNGHRLEGAVPPEQTLTLIHQLGRPKPAAAGVPGQ